VGRTSPGSHELPGEGREARPERLDRLGRHPPHAGVPLAVPPGVLSRELRLADAPHDPKRDRRLPAVGERYGLSLLPQHPLEGGEQITAPRERPQGLDLGGEDLGALDVVDVGEPHRDRIRRQPGRGEDHLGEPFGLRQVRHQIGVGEGPEVASRRAVPHPATDHEVESAVDRHGVGPLPIDDEGPVERGGQRGGGLLVQRPHLMGLGEASRSRRRGERHARVALFRSRSP